MSVESAGGLNYLYAVTPGSNLPNIGANDWQVGFWYKDIGPADTYKTSFMYVDPGVSGITMEWYDTVSAFDKLSLLAYYGGATHVLFTGIPDNYAGWMFISISHIGTTNEYRIRARLEGENNFSTDVTNFSLSELIFQYRLEFLSNQYGEGLGARYRSLFVKDYVLSDGDLLTASGSLLQPSGTNLTFLALDDHTTATDNQGTGDDWSLTGTLSTSLDEPNVELPSGYSFSYFKF